MKMDCTFSRAEMAAALARLSGVLPTRSVLPVAYCVRFSPSEDGESVRMETTDMDRHAEASVRLSEPCEGFAPVCVPLATLLAFARAYAGVSARLVEGAGGGLMAFSSGGSKANLPTIPGREFPNIATEEGFAHVGGGPSAAFKDALSRVAYAQAIGTEKPACLGVNVGQNGTGFVAVATNGHVAAKEVVAGWKSTMEPATLPTHAVNALLRFLPDEGNISLYTSDSRVRLVTECCGAFLSGTLEQRFPYVDQVIPKDNPIIVRINREALLSAIKRVKLVVEDKDTHRTTYEVSGTGIAIHAESESGSADEFVAADVTGASLRIGFNANYVTDMLNSLSGETVIAEMKEPHYPTLWRTEQGEGVRVLMPLNLS